MVCIQPDLFLYNEATTQLHNNDYNWGEPERAPHDDLAIRDGSMVHERNQHEQKRTRCVSRAPAITSGLWFHGS